MYSHKIKNYYNFSEIVFRESLPENSYEELGFKYWIISGEATELLLGFFHDENIINFSIFDSRPDYLSTQFDDPNQVEKLLNNSIVYYSEPRNQLTLHGYEQLMKVLSLEIEKTLGFAFKVVNVRATATKNSPDFGPTSWHTDGGPNSVKKIMFYLNPMNIENGSLEIIAKNGQGYIFKTEGPTAVLADVASLRHKGMPPTVNSVRPMIEITIIPAEKTNTRFVYAGHNAKIPIPSHNNRSFLLESFFSDDNTQEVEKLRNLFSELNIRNINLGGGRRFQESGWINFDEFSPNLNGRIQFNENTKLPYPDNFADIIYSSHCLEHLNDATVENLINESYRALKQGCKFIVKLPDFDRVLDESKAGIEDNILHTTHWGVNSLKEIWGMSGIEFSLQRRASMIFCGFWTSYDNNHFSDLNHNYSYHGPCRVSLEETTSILTEHSSPHLIAKKFRLKTLSLEKNISFNHQNAWSKDEFIQLVECFGFKLLKTSTSVFDSIQNIPSINSMAAISRYYEFIK